MGQAVGMPIIISKTVATAGVGVAKVGAPLVPIILGCPLCTFTTCLGFPGGVVRGASAFIPAGFWDALTRVTVLSKLSI